MKKVVAYVRVSTEEQASDGHHSIDTQTQFLTDYADGHNLSIVRIFVESHSAYRPGRPEFQAMLEFIHRHDDVRAILAYKLDRLTRNEVDHATLSSLEDVELVSATEAIPDGSTGRFLTNIYAAVARLSSDQTSERVKDAAQTKLRGGGYPGPAPTGYINNREAKTLEPDPIMAPIVRLVFETYAHEDIPLSRLVKRAEELGLRTKKGGRLAKGALHKLLTNPLYFGKVRWDGQTYEGNHEPIVSKPLFERVQARLAGKSSPLTKRHFPYRGLMTCGECGCKITASRIKGRYTYYHCTHGRGSCDQPRLREERVADLFLRIIEGVKLSSDQVRELLKDIESEGRRRKREARVRIRTIEQEQQRVGELRDRAYEDKLRGAITEERWLALEERWDEKAHALDEQRQALDLGLGPAEDEAEATFKLLQRMPYLYSRQSHEERVRLLRVVLSNSTLEGGKIEPIYRKPFDLVAEGVSSSLWLPGEDSNLQPFG